jgi:hypothetical protein
MMRDWARHLLAFEATADKDSLQTEPPTLLVYEKLRHQLNPLVGVDGFQLLAVRALKLAQSESPLLSKVQVTASGSLLGLGEVAPPHAPGAAPEDDLGILLIANLFGLFLTFLGTATTRQLVLNVFPHLDDASPSGAAIPFEGISNEVTQLRAVSDRLEALAEKHPAVTDGLTSISGNVRSIATILDVFAIIRNGSDTLIESDPKDLGSRYLM